MTHIDLYRKEISAIDLGILKLVKKRLTYAQKIGQEKRKLGLRIQDTKVEKDILLRHKKNAKKLHLDGMLVEKLIKLLIRYARKIQKEQS